MIYRLMSPHQVDTTIEGFVIVCQGHEHARYCQTFRELYGADISPTLVSNVTEAVLGKVIEWQYRPLDTLYPILYLDCIVIKIRQDKRVINKAVYLALGVNLEGKKELLGLWLSENKGAKFWLSVLIELKNRGVKDVFIACVDGLTGFPEAIAAAFPRTQVAAPGAATGPNLIAFFDYPDEIRKTPLFKIFKWFLFHNILLWIQAIFNKYLKLPVHPSNKKRPDHGKFQRPLLDRALAVAGYRYQKCGVQLGLIQPALMQEQLDLFDLSTTIRQSDNQALIQAMDRINRLR